MHGVRGHSVLAMLAAASTAEAIAQPLPTRDFVMVSLGDSAAAGEGAPNAPATPSHGASWNDFVCHRSDNAPAVLAFKALRAAHPNVHFAGDSLGRIKHFACSGAGIVNGLLGQQTRDNGEVKVPKSQIQQVRDWVGNPDPADPHPKIDALLISIGANDVGFEKLVKACMLPFAANPIPFAQPADVNDCSQGPSGKMFSDGEFNLNDHRPCSPGGCLYARLVDEITRQLPYVANVYMIEYFDPARDAAGKFCHLGPSPDFVGLTGAEAQWASQTVVAGLNRTIDSAVSTANGGAAKKTTWHMVKGISSQFSTHGVCSDSNYLRGRPVHRFVNTVGDSLFVQSSPSECDLGAAFDKFMNMTLLLNWSFFNDPTLLVPGCDYAGTMHPNPAGYRAYQAPIVVALSPLFERPRAPSNLTRVMTPTSIQIIWKDDSINEDVFQIQYRSGSNNWTTAQVPWGTRSWMLNGLSLGQTYTFQVRSCSYVVNSCSDWTSVSAVHQSPAAPGNVHLVRARGAGALVAGGPLHLHPEIVLQWDDNSNNEDGFEISVLDGSTWSGPRRIPANQTTLSFQNAPDFDGYRVRACISNVCSDWSVAH